jgi:hypothetical protein
MPSNVMAFFLSTPASQEYPARVIRGITLIHAQVDALMCAQASLYAKTVFLDWGIKLHYIRIKCHTTLP